MEAALAKVPKTAAELARIIRTHLPKAKDLKLAVSFDKAYGWRAKVYSTDPSSQAQVDAVVQGLRERYDLDDWRR